MDFKDIPAMYERWPAFPLVSISNAQCVPLPRANWLGTVYHGLPDELLEFSPDDGDYLVFLGRISPEKRPDRAIAIARATGMPLKIAAKVDNVDKAYFQAEIEPLLNTPLVEFIGRSARQISRLCLARPPRCCSRSPEPFGWS